MEDLHGQADAAGVTGRFRGARLRLQLAAAHGARGNRALFMEEGRVVGKASCNRFIGSYHLTGERLSFSQMGTTMMACEDDLSRQEERFLELLQAFFRFEISPEGRLVLHTPDGRSITAKR